MVTGSQSNKAPVLGCRNKRHACIIGNHSGQRGATIVESLIASLILIVGLFAMINVWYVSFQITMTNTDRSMACTLARHEIESIKETGFFNTSEYTVNSPKTTYYDVSLNKLTLVFGLPPSASRYVVTTSVVSDATVSGSNPVTPTNTALRTVIVTVKNYNSSVTLCTFTTYLARYGV